MLLLVQLIQGTSVNHAASNTLFLPWQSSALLGGFAALLYGQICWKPGSFGWEIRGCTIDPLSLPVLPPLQSESGFEKQEPVPLSFDSVGGSAAMPGRAEQAGEQLNRRRRKKQVAGGGTGGLRAGLGGGGLFWPKGEKLLPCIRVKIAAGQGVIPGPGAERGSWGRARRREAVGAAPTAPP